MGSSISLAMIVKDEGQVLDECLQSVRDLVDEIIIVDTGSRDETLEIAREHGARIVGYLWCDDFGAARNESLRLCTCLLYTSPSPRDRTRSRMPSSA